MVLWKGRSQEDAASVEREPTCTSQLIPSSSLTQRLEAPTTLSKAAAIRT